MAKYALITGCSRGGIGAALCEEFQNQGVHVFATARNLEKLGDIRNLQNVTAISLDVTKPESIAAAKVAVEKETGGRLDYLVNNSGAQYVAPMLDFDIQLGRDMYEVNVWGVVAMAQAFAPMLIAAKGTICNIGSISGLLNAPWMGVYGGSKAAINLISETLRVELAPFDVKVITCVTGSIETNIMTNSYKSESRTSGLYSSISKEIEDRAAGKDKPKSTHPREFARKLVKDCTGGASGKVYRGSLASVVNFMATYLPTGLLDPMISKGTGIDKLPGPAKA